MIYLATCGLIIGICTVVLVADWLPAPDRTDPRPVDEQLDRPRYIVRHDRPDVLVGEAERRPIGQALAARLQRDEAMEVLAAELTAEIAHSDAMRSWAVDLAQLVVALGGTVPALPSQLKPVLDETEAGAR